MNRRTGAAFAILLTVALLVAAGCSPSTPTDGSGEQTSPDYTICTHEAYVSDPDISGNTVVWMDERNGNKDIYGYNLDTGTEFPVITDSTDQWNPDIAGDIVVWMASDNESYDIYGYNLSSKTGFPICTDPAAQWYPRVSGNTVVWTDERNDDNDIYGYDLSTDTEFPICTAVGEQDSPVISGDIVVWRDMRTHQPGIYGYDLSSGTEFPIILEDADEEDLRWHLDMDRDIIVWEYLTMDEGLVAEKDIYGYDLTTDTEFPICTNRSDQYNPAVSGDIVIWLDDRGGSTGIYGYNISTKELSLV